ncbi:MAG TPA: extracellular solute-binding protein [Herbaspirillum sp.]|jgi:iron(III) transport system substrate-binding protein
MPDVKRAWIVLTFTLSFLLFVPASMAQTLQQMAVYQGADRQQLLVEEAKKEGSLVFYTTIPSDLVGQLVEPFEKKYGIKVVVWRTRDDLVLQRVIMESRSDKHMVDVINIPTVSLEALRRENLLQEIRSPYQKDLLPSVVPAHHEWASISVSVRVQAYNTNAIRKEDLPKNYHDLLSPKWKGKLGIEANSHEWVSSVIKDMGQTEGVKFFSDLAGNGLSTRSGYPLLTKLVATGDVPMALTVLPHSVEEQKKLGAPIDWFVIKEPAIGTPGGVAVPKKVPHPYAALLFYDFMISPEGQSLIVKIGYIPTNQKVESPFKNLKFKLLDPTVMLDEEEKSFNQFRQLILDRGQR